MLFSRIYNWIKYKSLSPSILFTNRIFVERDSKHRRVTSNIGLTYRNSKWSSYARTNVNLHKKEVFLWIKFLLLLSLVAVLLSLSKYYGYGSLFTPLTTLVWFLCDADLYLKAAFIASTLSSLQVATSLLQSYLFTTIYGKNWYTNTSSRGNASYSIAKSPLPKSLHRPLLRYYASCDGSSDQFNKLFRPGDINSLELDTLLLYRNLFRVVYFLKASAITLSETKVASISITNPHTTVLNKVLGLFTAKQFNKKTLGLLQLDYLIFTSPTSATNSWFKECSRWSLCSINREISSCGTGIAASNGLIYDASSSYPKINTLVALYPELYSIQTSIDNQLSSIRTQRWLYKYNILHRSALKHASFLTTTKKLLGSGFVTETLTSRNVWASSTLLTSTQSVAKLKPLYSAVYGNFQNLTPNNYGSLFTQPTDLNYPFIDSLNFYETSYYWFIQRSYLFNTLSSNTVELITPRRDMNTGSSSIPTNQFANSLVRLENFNATRYGILNSQLGKQPLNLTLDYSNNRVLVKHRSEQIQNMLRTRSVNTVPYYSPTHLTKLSLPVYDSK